jgi:transcriptional regulator with XRE-family HTH domain
MQTSGEFGNHFRQLRKARGLSQQKFADVVDISYRHVNFLENSRAKPSREAVLKIASALGLSLKNTNVLLRSAGFSSSFDTTSLDDQTLTFAKAALLQIIEHQNPYPGIVMSPIGELLMANDAVFNLFKRLVSAETIASINNVYEFFLTNETIKRRLVNWHELAPKLLALIRQEVFEIDTMSDAYNLLKRLESSIDLEELSGDTKPADSLDTPLFTMQFRIDSPEQFCIDSPEPKNGTEVELNFFSTYTTFGTPHDIALQELRIECFYPADEYTREYCQHLTGA